MGRCKLLLDLVRILEGVVEILDQIGSAGSQHQPDCSRHEQLRKQPPAYRCARRRRLNQVDRVDRALLRTGHQTSEVGLQARQLCLERGDFRLRIGNLAGAKHLRHFVLLALDFRLGIHY